MKANKGIKNIFDKINDKSLSSSLLRYFIIYGCALIVLIFITQSLFLGAFYRLSMRGKLNKALHTISNIYISDANISYEDFRTMLGSVSSENDVYIYIESEDGKFRLSSSDVAKNIRVFPEMEKTLKDARTMLENSANHKISFLASNVAGGGVMVSAEKLSGGIRQTANIYAAASLIPMGPAVSIISTQLLLVSGAVFVFAGIVAVIASKLLAKPIIRMSREAKKLGEGDFDVEFDGGDIKEIKALADALNDASSKLKVTDELQKDLVANVSHDIRTPLTMIKSYAELIHDITGDDKEKREKNLEVIINESDRLAALVNDMLLLSKMQSGSDGLKLECFNLKQVVMEVLDTFEIMEEQGYSIECQMEADTKVIADMAKIKQVLSNLVSNAVKYSEDEKTIRVTSELGDGFVTVKVIDRGIGIPEDEQKNIWNRYQRSSQKGTRYKDGTGLGLSICSEILKMHKSEYGVESILGEGSTFWFKLKLEK